MSRLANRRLARGAVLTPACETAVGFLSRHHDETSCSRLNLRYACRRGLPELHRNVTECMREPRGSPDFRRFDKFGYNFYSVACPRLGRL